MIHDSNLYPKIKVIFISIVACDGSKSAWTINVIGDSNIYKEEYKEGTFTNGIIMIRSLIWPGAYIFYKDGRWFNFYIGFGHKFDNCEYYPISPQLPRECFSDPAEQSEPNPKEAHEEDEKDDEINPEAVPGFIESMEGILNDTAKFEELVNKVFDDIDTNHSGQLERNEIQKLLKHFSEVLNIPLGSKPVKTFLKSFDKDKSGTISKEELSEPLKGLLSIWLETLKEKLVPARL